MSDVDPWEIRAILAEALTTRIETKLAVDQTVSLILRPLPDVNLSDREGLAQFVQSNVDAVRSQEIEVYEGYRRMLKCQMSASLGAEALRGFLAVAPASENP